MAAGTPPQPRRRWARRALLGLLGIAAAGALAWAVLDRPLPEGHAGRQADALARRMLAGVDAAAWERTGAVRWTFAGRRAHLWDRQRHWARVRWGDVEVQLDLTTRRGLAWVAGVPAPAEEVGALVDEAWATWVNDAFWLNPVVKVFDEGVERRLVAGSDGDAGLLVTYGRGGATPGDSYLWLIDEDGLPRAWRMWVSIVPVGGLRATWEGWRTLSTGARVATRHRLLGFNLALSDVAGAATLADLEPGADPFAPLAGGVRVP